MDNNHLLTLVIDCISKSSQVTIARVYNWDVHQRRTQQAAAATTIAQE